VLSLRRDHGIYEFGIREAEAGDGPTKWIPDSGGAAGSGRNLQAVPKGTELTADFFCRLFATESQQATLWLASD
jgi:hypothetical protein